jgi:PBP1b-binding outer membrane lipoprotein LpoB
MIRGSFVALFLALVLGGCSSGSAIPRAAATSAPTATPNVQITFTIEP